MIRSRMRPRSGRKMTMNLDLLAGEFSHCKLESNVSATCKWHCQWPDYAFDKERLQNNKPKLVTIVTHV